MACERRETKLREGEGMLRNCLKAGLVAAAETFVPGQLVCWRCGPVAGAWRDGRSPRPPVAAFWTREHWPRLWRCRRLPAGAWGRRRIAGLIGVHDAQEF